MKNGSHYDFRFYSIFLIFAGVGVDFVDFYGRDVLHFDTFSTVIANFIRIKVASFTL